MGHYYRLAVKITKPVKIFLWAWNQKQKEGPMPDDDEKLSERKWREKLRDATELLEMFKRSAYINNEL
jgi:hypothetical protein